MAEIFNKFNMDFELANRKSLPIISCVTLDELGISPEDCKTIDIGIELSGKLKVIPKERRTESVQKFLDELLKSCEEHKFRIENIDLLFNPEYKLNVLSYFVDLARTKSLLIQWPGKFSEGYLLYSEYQFEDYAKYKVEEYNIACIK